jgi:dynein heavy chain
MRMFPSLVNCCTLDYFSPWSNEALNKVAKSKFENIQFNLDDEELEKVYKDCVVDICPMIHTSV